MTAYYRGGETIDQLDNGVGRVQGSLAAVPTNAHRVRNSVAHLKAASWSAAPPSSGGCDPTRARLKSS